MIAIIDYGVGNLESISQGLRRLGQPSRLVHSAEELAPAQAIILPGVGAFDAAVSVLTATGLDQAIRRQAGQGVPLLGICLGMQLLFSGSEEGTEPGLGLLAGQVVRLPPGLKVPQLGWNWVQWQQPEGAHAHYYFAHSYYARAHADDIRAQVEYGISFPAVVNRENVWGVQFHPEKSGHAGLALLRAWIEGRLDPCS